MSTEGRERRGFPRIEAKHAVMYKVLGDENNEALRKTKVLGLGGCMFETDSPPGVGTVLELLISLEQRVIKAKAGVVYQIDRDADAWEVGVEFLEVAPDDQRALKQLFEKQGEEGQG